MIKQLAAKADVVVENYPPRRQAPPRHRLRGALGDQPAAHLRAASRASARTGPTATGPGFDQIAQGMGGLMSITGLPGQGPVRVGIPIADLTAGLFAAHGHPGRAARARALRQGPVGRTPRCCRRRSPCSTSRRRAGSSTSEVPPQAGNDHPTAIPTGVFKTADGHINIAAVGPEDVAALVRGARRAGARLTHPDSRQRAAALEEPRCAQRDDRGARTVNEHERGWIDALNEAGVPCGPINSIDEVFDDPQVKHLGIAQSVRTQTSATSRCRPGGAPRAARRARSSRRAPEHGEHTDEVLREFGYGAGGSRGSAATARCDRRPSGAGPGCRLASHDLFLSREVEMSVRANERVAWFNGEFMPESEVRIPFRDFELGLRRRLLRHDPQLRPPPVQGEGARRAALPLAQIPAHRPGLRAGEDVRADRGGVRAQPPPARPRRRLLGRPAHQPRRQGGRRATISTITGPTSCSNARRCRSCSAPSCSRTASGSSCRRTAACRRIRSPRAPRRTTT